MKKTICITSSDEAVTYWAESLDILSQFKRLGFTTRQGFISLIQEKNEKYKDYKLIKKLEYFWIMRSRCEELNSDLVRIIEELKAE